ncbi:MAG: TIR domain-containing protein [Scytonema sp. RU_4_4]|nr:TIR domain-containing protein [Scytonema sp. RU_4_4]NJR75263.1 TIR domain-containing protein [Scytonema sp. CRU_2_7]
MAEQNPEVVLEALRQNKKIHLEISKASDSLWQVSLAFPPVKESQPSSLPTVDSSSLSLESKVTPLLSNSVTTPDTDSAEQSSTSSESSTPDSPVQPSNLNSKESQSNPTDLPTLNQPVQSSSSDATTSQFNTINSNNKNLLTPLQSSRSKKTSKRDSRKVYDVFLSYKTEDRKMVEDIGFQLTQKWGLYCWFDEWCLGNHSVYDEIEKQAKTVKSVAIFIGKHGIGNFQNKEIKVFLAAKDRRGLQGQLKSQLKIIPVILQGGDKSQLRLFLTDYKWVDFNSKQYPEAVEELFWRIKGVSPFNPLEALEDED